MKLEVENTVRNADFDISTNDSLIYLGFKRLLDILASLLGLVCSAPLMLIIGILIKLDDPEGPVFFIQNRCGKDGLNFNMFKFRSMVHNAEEMKEELLDQNKMNGPVFKMENDPRITSIGKWLRKTSLDELPQLINVLKGEMSLVGPRPPLPEEVKEYSNYEMQRLLVKPGITCFWQVNGRNNIDFKRWVELDLKYIKKRNFLLDLKLILKTIPVILGDENAM